MILARAILMGMALGACLANAGCASVLPWERGTLAKPAMTPDDTLGEALLEQVLRRLPGLTIGVLGDLFLDRYLDIDAALTERSIETGLDAYQVVRVRSYPGAAGTVINNLAALGAGGVMPVSVIGDDGEGYELRQALDLGLPREGELAAGSLGPGEVA